MQDVTDIAHVYYRIDSGEWINTGVTQGTCTGYQVDISGLADGKHRIEVCGEDALGNMGDPVSAELWTDRTKPENGEVQLLPSVWSCKDRAEISWSGAMDAISGIAKIEYAIDGGWKDTGSTASDGSVTADLNRLSDGIHEVAFRVTDMAGNVLVPVQMQLRRDTTRPELLIMAPAGRAIADGEVQVRGTVSDLHLAGWKLEAKDSHGAVRNLASWQKKEGEAEQTELQAVIDLSAYSDGENVVLNFSAWDEAGNEAKADRTLIRVGGAMSAFEPTLDLFVPELIKEAQVSPVLRFRVAHGFLTDMMETG